MRRIARLPLRKNVRDYLRKRQNKADMKQALGTLNATAEWKSARTAKSVTEVLVTLQRMMGVRERCMYCLDSHGADIEHFWPKTPYPGKMFHWPNLLLCCTECGRLKGDRFPLDQGQPLLVDPTVEEPWEYLDFDPGTGNIVARFDVSINVWSPKGLKTVETLQLDRREALAAGYRKTFLRLSSIISDRLNTVGPILPGIIDELKEADDHGLLGWCFIGFGQNIQPFSDLRVRHPDVWVACIAAISVA